MKLHYIAIILIVAVAAGCIQLTHPKVVCETLTDTNQRNECIYNQSVASLDPNGCGNIVGEQLRSDCIDKISVEVLDFYPCKLHDKQFQRDACETKVGDARKAARKVTTTTKP